MTMPASHRARNPPINGLLAEADGAPSIRINRVSAGVDLTKARRDHRLLVLPWSLLREARENTLSWSEPRTKRGGNSYPCAERLQQPVSAMPSKIAALPGPIATAAPSEMRRRGSKRSLIPHADGSLTISTYGAKWIEAHDRDVADSITR